MGDDVDHSKDGQDGIALSAHLDVRLVDELVGFLYLFPQFSDFVVSGVEVLKLKDLLFVLGDDVMELDLLFFESLDPCLVLLDRLFMLFLHAGHLLLDGHALRVQEVALFVCEVLPLLALVRQQSVSLREALVEDLDEGFENVVKEEGADEAAVVLVSLEEADFLLIHDVEVLAATFESLARVLVAF